MYLATMLAPSGAKREVAVKILHPGIDPTAQAIQRLQDEARLLGLLQHPSIIRVVDLLQYKNRLALVTEYVDGQDLNACIDAVPPPSPRAMIEIMGRVASALDAAWRTPSPDGRGELHLIHRDIKPSNIRISSAGDVKLLDFGLAHAEHADRQAKTANHALIGSFLYMAPERYLQLPNSSASDAFGIGCCLYEGLSGHKLFEGRKPVDLYGLLIDAQRWDAEMDARVAAIPSTVSPEARHICRRLLDREPEDRMTVTELADTWEDVVEQVAGPSLAKWAKERVWPEPEPIRASLEGSLVASRVKVLAFTPDEEDELEDEPTVRISAKAMEALDIPAATRAEFVPEGETVLRRAPTIPQQPVAPPAPPSQRTNWFGALFLATTTAVIVFLVSILATAVVGVIWNREPPAPTGPSAEAPALPPQQTKEGAHVHVTGALSASLQRGSTTVPAGAVSPGMWTLWVDLGDGPARMGTLRLPAGASVNVPCDLASRTCTLPGDEP